MNRTWGSFLCAAILSSALSTNALAQCEAGNIYTDLGTFQAAAPGLPVETFEEGILIGDSFPAPLNSTSDNDTFDPGDILPGIEFNAILTAVNGLELFDSVGPITADGKGLITLSDTDGLGITLNPGVSAFGAQVYSEADSVRLVFTTNGGAGSYTVDLPGGTGTTGGGAFLGCISAFPITGVELTAPIAASGQYEAVDNVTFGEPMVAPSDPGSLSIDDVTVNEDVGTATLTVSRTGGSDGALQVDFATVDGSALAPGDYTATNGQLNWGDGDSAGKSVNIPIIDDSDDESDETFNVVLSNVEGGAALADDTGQVTITDNDDPVAPPPPPPPPPTTPPAPMLPVPTLGQWASLMLILSMVLFGAASLRRRRLD